MGGVYILNDLWLSRPEKLESIAVILGDTFLSLIANYNIEHS